MYPYICVEKKKHMQKGELKECSKATLNKTGNKAIYKLRKPLSEIMFHSCKIINENFIYVNMLNILFWPMIEQIIISDLSLQT